MVKEIEKKEIETPSQDYNFFFIFNNKKGLGLNSVEMETCYVYVPNVTKPPKGRPVVFGAVF